MMLGVSAEQEELRASVRRFLADRAPMSRVRELMETETGTDRAVWAQAGAQLGLEHDLEEQVPQFFFQMCEG